MMHISHLLIVITIVLLYSLYTNASVASTVASPPSSTSTSTSSSSSSSTTTSIATFGFNTIKGNDILTSLQQYNNNNNIFYIKLSKPSNLITFDKVDTVIVNINDNHYIDDSLLEISSYIIENSIYRGTLTNLLILIDNDNPKLIDKVNNIINDAYNLLKKYNNEQRLLLEQLVSIEIVSLTSIDKESLSNIIKQKITSSQSLLSLKDTNEILSSLSLSSSSSSHSIKENDKAAEACNAIVEAFVANLVDRLPPNVPFQGSVMDLDEFTSFVSAAVVTAAEVNSEQYLDVFTKYEASSSMNRAYYRARIGATIAVYPIYREAIEALLAKTLENFDTSIKKIKPNSSLVQSLKKQAAISVNDFTSKASTLQKGIKSILTKNSVGLFGSSAKGNKQLLSSIDARLSVSYDTHKLHKLLSEACKERENSLFVQGAYNPFIRSMPFPPTKINLNYLVDPRAASFGLTYDKLYDEHKDGAAINRAEPLIINGVAKIPFDLNEHAKPKESKPWYTVIKELWDNLE